MKKKIVVAIIIIVFIIGGGIGGYFLYDFLSKHFYIDRRPCVEFPFTSYPAEMNRITTISPLGNLNPPGHTFPTDHMYFNTNTTMYPDGFEIFAPGNLTITALSKVTYDPPQGIIAEDYSIEFSVCKSISGKFGHVNNLSSFILSQIGGFGAEYGDRERNWEVAGDHFYSYYKEIVFSVDAGQLLGRAGMGGGFDFWLKDTRVNLEWVNQDWTKEFQHTVSALAYYNSTQRSVMEAKLLRWDGVPVDPAGYHGRVEFDVADRGQGIWVRSNWTNRAEDYGLALVYDNFNASEGVISIGLAGNSSWDSRAYTFIPRDTGFRNRNFSDVMNDGNVYYYFCDQFKSGSIYTKVILLKMTGNREIYLQFVDYGSLEIPSDPSSLFNQADAIQYIR